MEKIQTREDFRKWARVRMAEQDISQRALAKKLNCPQPRLSEALHGKPSGRKYVEPLIRALGGDPADFREVI